MQQTFSIIEFIDDPKNLISPVQLCPTVTSPTATTSNYRPPSPTTGEEGQHAEDMGNKYLNAVYSSRSYFLGDSFKFDQIKKINKTLIIIICLCLASVVVLILVVWKFRKKIRNCICNCKKKDEIEDEQEQMKGYQVQKPNDDEKVKPIEDSQDVDEDAAAKANVDKDAALEQERLKEVEKNIAEQEILETARIENERIEQERIEKERIENERIEQERIEKTAAKETAAKEAAAKEQQLENSKYGKHLKEKAQQFELQIQQWELIRQNKIDEQRIEHDLRLADKQALADKQKALADKQKDDEIGSFKNEKKDNIYFCQALLEGNVVPPVFQEHINKNALEKFSEKGYRVLVFMNYITKYRISRIEVDMKRDLKDFKEKWTKKIADKSICIMIELKRHDRGVSCLETYLPFHFLPEKEVARVFGNWKFSELGVLNCNSNRSIIFHINTDGIFNLCEHNVAAFKRLNNMLLDNYYLSD